MTRILVGVRAAWYCRRNAIPVRDPVVLTVAGEAAKRVRLKRIPELLQTAAPIAPCTIGLRRPAVILPSAILESVPLRQVLLHEFAHVRRRDSWVGLGQRIVSALYWFSPFLPALQRDINLAREELCDAEVVRSEPATDYARTLVELADHADFRPNLLAGVSMIGSSLETRIERMLTALPPARWGRTRLIGAATAFAAALAFVAVEFRSAVSAAPFDDAQVKVSPFFRGAEMHVVGVYGSSNRDGQTIDVLVKPTEKPLVLVLTAYEQTTWNLKFAPGAQLRQVILAGYYQQSVLGLPPYASVQYHTYFPQGLSPKEPGFFYAYQRESPEFSKLKAALDGLTGLEIKSFLGQQRAKSVEVGGLPESAERAACAQCDLQVVGVYTGKGKINGSTITVDVKPTEKPIVLALMSYSPVTWNVQLAPGAQVKTVVLAGYYHQKIDGLPKEIPVIVRTYFGDGMKVRPDATSHFWAYKESSPEYQNAIAELKRLTGLDVKRFRGGYDPARVVVE